MILEEHKVPLSIYGEYLDRNGIKKKFKGSARITGDQSDHVSLDKRQTSLNFKLSSGSIGGVVNFRLLIPETRRNEKEILWSILMESAAYPTPYRKYIQANIFGTKETYIFSEKAKKEFLESNGFREMPIIEWDESQLWQNKKFELSKIPHCQYTLENPEFIKNYVSAEISYIAIGLCPKIKNIDDVLKDTLRDVNKNHNIVFQKIEGIPTEVISLKKHKKNHTIIKDVNKDNLWKVFDVINNKYAAHGLSTNNRKFIYDAIYNTYIPIYFDGDVKYSIYDEYGKDPCQNLKNIKITEEINTYLKLIEAKFLSRTLNKPMSNEDRCVAIDVLNYFSKNNFLKHPNEKKKSLLRNVSIRKLKDFKYDTRLEWLKSWEEYKKYGKNKEFKSKNINKNFYYQHAKNTLFECEFHQQNLNKCKKNKNLKKIKKVFSGNIKPNIYDGFKYYPIINFDYKVNINESFLELNENNSNTEFKVPKNSIFYIKVNTKNSNLNITLENSSSNFVIYNSNILNTKISINEKLTKSSIKTDAAYNTKLLTSCFTVINSYIEDSDFNSAACSREDSINFISSKGVNISLKILNSSFDAFDADFSDIHFKNILIENAGNDCIDLSSGIYNLRNISTNNCGDKAISVGEKSLVSIQNLKATNSLIGIASKDSSKTYLSKGLEFKNIKNCLTTYQKKQEFENGNIYYDNVTNCKYAVLNKNIIKNNEICSHVDRNDLYETCLAKNKIIVNSLDYLPKDTNFFIRENNTIKNITYEKKCNKKLNCKIEIPLYFSSKNISFGLMDGTNKNVIYENALF